MLLTGLPLFGIRRVQAQGQCRRKYQMILRHTVNDILTNAIIILTAQRKNLGLSQQELSRSLGWKSHGVWEIEAGKHEPRMDKLTALAQALGLELKIEFTKIENYEQPKKTRKPRMLKPTKLVKRKRKQPAYNIPPGYVPVREWARANGLSQKTVLSRVLYNKIAPYQIGRAHV